MRTKALSLLAFAAVFGITASAQSTRDQIEKAFRDPRRKENEAKADRQLHDKNKIISDTTASSVTPSPRKKKMVKRKKS